MSSVSMNGHDYKPCMQCGEWTDYLDLLYRPPSIEAPYGLDICPKCSTPGDTEQNLVTIVLNAQKGE